MRLIILVGILCLLSKVGYADTVGTISNKTLICDPKVEIYCLEKHFF
ncbi:MAG: hypothetical protein AB1472_03185 [Candidatus Omnitrophota bacterium]